MALLWFTAGILTSLASLVALLPWLRRLRIFNSLPALPWPASAAAVLVVVAVLIMSRWLGAPAPATASLSSTDAAVSSRDAAKAVAPPFGGSDTAGTFGTAAKVFGAATGGTAVAAGTATGTAPAPGQANAGSMDAAISSLEARLAKGGGSPDDWELLAKSFEFLGRPADAAKARAHQIPPASAGSMPPGGAASAAGPMPPVMASSAAAAPKAAGTRAVSGEVSLAQNLGSKASPGATLFIVAKSVDAPGIPVAVFRGAVGKWPLKFTLDDSQSMMPGRNLSSAGRVTIEARISLKGQPLPSPGDLQGSSGIINPGDTRPLKITIDREIS